MEGGYDSDDADSVGSQSKKQKLKLPSSPVIELAIDRAPPPKPEEPDEDDFDFEEVEADPLLSCACARPVVTGYD
jgi:hypothetical protein